MTIIFQACCSKPEPRDVIVIDKSEIVSNPDGSYTVNKAWMLKRLQLEKDLAKALEACLGETK